MKVLCFNKKLAIINVTLVTKVMTMAGELTKILALLSLHKKKRNIGDCTVQQFP